MEFGERKRSRKSQSFKLVNRDYHDEDKAADYSSDVNGEAKHEAPFFGDESMEIKKQITGMRRLLNDSTGRIYQRVGEEGEHIKEEPQEVDLVWVKSMNPPSEPRPPSRPPPSPAWSSPSPPMGHVPGKYGTRSKSNHNLVRPSGGSNGETPTVNSLAGSNCCTCNCQPILIAILQELKAMRQFVQLQAGNQNRQQPSNSCVCAPRSPVARKRNRKRKLPLKLVLPLAFRKPSLPVAEKKPLRISATSRLSGTESTSPKVENQGSGYGIVQESFSSDPEVQLAEGFDVLMHKSQLDSILTNYTRSGSLLFRKLVCAFFDDKTLANSLPNGKRKRGLNDNRKGLDQNIVGAIKVFTEKYCSANHVDKVPGPRDWVQILQDQIKLARRRLKRGSNSAEAGECEEKTEVMSVQETGKPAESPTEQTCENSEQEHSS